MGSTERVPQGLRQGLAGVPLMDESSMADNSAQYKVLKLPLWAAGFVALCLFLSRSAPDVTPAPRAEIDSASATRLIQQGIEQGKAELAAGKYSTAQVERNLRLRLKLEDSPERKLEVAGGLYAVATALRGEHNSLDATRLAQQAADLAPGTLLAARCWILCGQASEVTSPELPLSIRYFDRANVALLGWLKQHPEDAEAIQLRAAVLYQLSQTEGRFARHEEAIQHLREITDLSPVAQALNPGDRLRAMVRLGDLLAVTGQAAESARWLSTAQEYGKQQVDFTVPAAEILHALAEPARREALNSAAPSYDSLRLLWERDRFESLPEWFQIGDELASAYFFHEPPQLADFQLVVGKLLSTIPKALDSLPRESTQRAELESIYATNLLLAADAAKNRHDQAEVARLVALFESTFHSRDVNFISPQSRPAVRMHRIAEIYRTTMPRHIEQLRKIQTSGNTPPRR